MDLTKVSCKRSLYIISSNVECLKYERFNRGRYFDIFNQETKEYYTEVNLIVSLPYTENPHMYSRSSFYIPGYINPFPKL